MTKQLKVYTSISRTLDETYLENVECTAPGEISEIETRKLIQQFHV